MHRGINRDIQNTTMRTMSSDLHQPASVISASTTSIECLEDSFAELMKKALSALMLKNHQKNPHRNISQNHLQAAEMLLSKKNESPTKSIKSMEKKVHTETDHSKNSQRDNGISSAQKKDIKQIQQVSLSASEMSHDKKSLRDLSDDLEEGASYVQMLNNHNDHSACMIDHALLLPQTFDSPVLLDKSKNLDHFQWGSDSTVAGSTGDLLNSQDLPEDFTKELRLLHSDSLRYALSLKGFQTNALANAVHIDVLPPPIQSERPCVENLTRMIEEVSKDIPPSVMFEGQENRVSSRHFERNTSANLTTSPPSIQGTSSQNVSSIPSTPSNQFSSQFATHSKHVVSSLAMTTADRDTTTTLRSTSYSSPSQKGIHSPSPISFMGSFKDINGSQSTKMPSSPSLAAEILQQIKEAMKKNLTAMKKGETHLHLTLTPKELGEVNIRLSILESGKINAAFSASHPEALDILTSYRFALKEIFEAAGLDAGQLSFFMGSEQGDRSSHFQSSQDKTSSDYATSRAGMESLDIDVSEKVTPNRLSSYQIDVTA